MKTRSRSPAPFGYTHMKLSYCTLLAVLATCLSASGSTHAQQTKEPVELTVPFPSTSPRPNAAVIYCVTALNNELSANDEAVVSRSFVGWRARLRVMFSGSDVLLSVADSTSSGQDEYRDPVRYTAATASPSDFAGSIYIAADRPGSANVLAINRVTGTLIWSAVSASGYTRSNTAFYVCGPRPSSPLPPQ